LGNIGREYEGTRHNVGFEVLNRLSRVGWGKRGKFDAETVIVGELVLAKPVTLMNNSGKAVKKLIDFYKVDLSDLWVIHDDLDIKLGEYKLQKGVGPKIHNGILSVERSLGNKDFWRIRVGVDSRNGDRNIPGEDYVLKRFNERERKMVEEVIEKIRKELLEMV